MKTFRCRTYEIYSSKIKKTVRFALLADLHGLEFGSDNRELLAAVEKGQPDAVLVAGDMIVRMEKETLFSAEKLLVPLAKKYPVFYSLGNHEYRMDMIPQLQQEYRAYEDRLSESGVVFLHNKRKSLKIRETEFVFHGLELPMEYYKKPKSPMLTGAALKELAGTPKPGAVNVLLAHSPKYGKTYLDWGAELIVSGHYHGGVLRLTEHRGLTSPQYLLFPPYCCGDFHKGDSHMIVSPGLGEHTIPLRIHNPRELLFIDMKNPLEKKK